MEEGLQAEALTKAAQKLVRDSKAYSKQVPNVVLQVIDEAKKKAQGNLETILVMLSDGVCYERFFMFPQTIEKYNVMPMKIYDVVQCSIVLSEKTDLFILIDFKILKNDVTRLIGEPFDYKSCERRNLNSINVNFPSKSDLKTSTHIYNNTTVQHSNVISEKYTEKNLDCNKKDCTIVNEQLNLKDDDPIINYKEENFESKFFHTAVYDADQKVISNPSKIIKQNLVKKAKLMNSAMNVKPVYNVDNNTTSRTVNNKKVHVEKQYRKNEIDCDEEDEVYTLIKNQTIHTMSWILKGRIIRKSPLKTYNDKNNKIGNMMAITIIDRNGDIIKAMFWNNSAIEWNNKQENKFVYAFTGGGITQKGNFNKLNNQIEIHFSNNIKIKKLHDDSSILRDIYHFTSIQSILTLPLNQVIDVMTFVGNFLFNNFIDRAYKPNSRYCSENYWRTEEKNQLVNF